MKETMAGGLRSYLRDIGRYPLIPHDRTVELFREMRDTEDSRRRQEIRKLLVSSNLRLVVSIAKQYKGQGVDMIDLIQEGSVGLMTAVNRFDPDMGFRLSTYASYWIKQAIRRHLTGTEQLAGARTVRLPSHVVALLPRIRNERRRLVDELGAEPDAELIAANLEVTVDSVRAALDASGPVLSASIDNSDNSATRTRGVASVTRLEMAMQDSNNFDPMETDLEQITLSTQLRDIVRRAFTKLSAREEQVIRLRFGVMEDPDSDDFQMTAAERCELDRRTE